MANQSHSDCQYRGFDYSFVVQAALRSDFITVEEYLAGEQLSDVRHEYVDGVVYAMVGGTREHNQIAGNIYAALLNGLRSGPCRPFIFDLKARVQVSRDHAVFYYPDVMVGCDSRDTHRLYLCYPKVLIEVSSDSTERTDRHEKFSAYKTIETLEEYVIVFQDRPEAMIIRRHDNWRAETIKGLDHVVVLKSLDMPLPLLLIYQGVQLQPL